MSLEIYGTLGPSCSTQKTIEELLKVGMTGMRLNLSHCNLNDRKEWLDAFHQACKNTGVQADLMIDMCGPELRILDIDPILIIPDSKITLNSSILPAQILNRAEKDDILLMDDGKIKMQVLDVMDNSVHCLVHYGSEIKARKSVMIQGKQILGPLFTDSDLKNLKHAKEFGITSIMQPFVSSKNDLIMIKDMLNSLELEHLKIDAKIENMSGVEHIEEMINQCDCIVIARGDLGNACGLTHLPYIQKQIEHHCHQSNQKYMVVTEMLNSMIQQPVPTRAEVSDVFHAVYHGAEAIMLTAETASGKYPVEAMQFFVQVAKEAIKTKEKENRL